MSDQDQEEQGAPVDFPGRVISNRPNIAALSGGRMVLASQPGIDTPRSSGSTDDARFPKDAHGQPVSLTDTNLMRDNKGQPVPVIPNRPDISELRGGRDASAALAPSAAPSIGDV